MALVFPERNSVQESGVVEHVVREVILNELGRQGWEVVGFAPPIVQGGTRLRIQVMLKRPAAVPVS